MHSNTNHTVILFAEPTSKLIAAVDGKITHVVFNNLKKAQKYLRTCDLKFVICDIIDEPSCTHGRKLIEYIRTILQDKTAPIIVVHPSSYVLDEPDWFIEHMVQVLELENEQLTVTLDHQLFTLLALANESRRAVEKRQVQVELLSTINRFSQLHYDSQTLIHHCANTLAAFCLASATCVAAQSGFDVEIPGKGKLNQSQYALLKQKGIGNLINKTFDLSQPDLNLSTNSEVLDCLGDMTNCSLNCYLVFPIRVFDKTVISIICFVNDDAMTALSTNDLDILCEAAQQLRLVLEKRSAETRLKSQYKRLKSTLSDLHTAQEQLIHAEKMASVGQMAAGLAHEINNPISFVISNLGPLDDYVTTLVKMLELHDQLVESIDTNCDSGEEIRHSLNQYKTHNQVDFLVDDIKAIVSDSRDGLLRVRDIISDLSDFSHKGHVETHQFNVEKLIKETLTLLKFEISNDISIQVINHIDQDILGHRGFTQQILSHVIKNSVQALSSTEQDDKCVVIQAEKTSTKFSLTIKDNGPGIEDSLLKQVFDLFYSTKDVGEGPGLGLAISYNLAKKMGAELKLSSVFGEGTTVVLSFANTA